MEFPLNVLIVEDSQADAGLFVHELKVAGFDIKWQRVETEADFLLQLKQKPDIILSDYSMPQFNGLKAASLLRKSGLKIPFILVSGRSGEDVAVEAMKSGATDYLLKDSLGRLGTVVRRAMLEVEAQTHREQLEAQFIEAQKMELIGQLAGGIAHDFNNILGVIIGYCDLVISDDLPAPLREYCEEIRNASDRAVGLTRQLLLVSRKETVQPAVLDLDAVVKDLEKMLRRVISENITMTVVTGKPGYIKADSGYLGQLLMNLVVNARDAMPNGGHITISTDIATVSEDPLSKSNSSPQYARLRVSDNGTGMTNEVKARLFEAFFTTKLHDKGTGLGLATCKTIVQQSGGHIDVHSELGKGTIFEVFFPQVDQPLDPITATVLSARFHRGTETLLVVEDEPSLKQLACRVLEEAGYKVISAANGEEAWRRAQQHTGAPIRLILTDVVMPIMDGKELAKLFKKENPELKVLFTSGYSNDAVADHGMAESDVAFLPKPYTPESLARMVREGLDAQWATSK